MRLRNPRSIRSRRRRRPHKSNVKTRRTQNSTFLNQIIRRPSSHRNSSTSRSRSRRRILRRRRSQPNTSSPRPRILSMSLSRNLSRNSTRRRRTPRHRCIHHTQRRPLRRLTLNRSLNSLNPNTPTRITNSPSHKLPQTSRQLRRPNTTYNRNRHTRRCRHTRSSPSSIRHLRHKNLRVTEMSQTRTPSQHPTRPLR